MGDARFCCACSQVCDVRKAYVKMPYPYVTNSAYTINNNIWGNYCVCTPTLVCIYMHIYTRLCRWLLQMIRCVPAAFLQIWEAWFSVHVRNAALTPSINIVSVGAFRIQNASATGRVVLVVVGCRTTCEILSLRVGALLKVMTLRVGQRLPLASSYETFTTTERTNWHAMSMLYSRFDHHLDAILRSHCFHLWTE